MTTWERVDASHMSVFPGFPTAARDGDSGGERGSVAVGRTGKRRKSVLSHF